MSDKLVAAFRGHIDASDWHRSKESEWCAVAAAAKGSVTFIVREPDLYAPSFAESVLYAFSYSGAEAVVQTQWIRQGV